jgi:hypothetical protein
MTEYRLVPIELLDALVRAYNAYNLPATEMWSQALQAGEKIVDEVTKNACPECGDPNDGHFHQPETGEREINVPQIRWNFERQVWEVHAVVKVTEMLAEADAIFPHADIYKPSTGWPLGNDHPDVIAAEAATREYDAMHAVRSQRREQANRSTS